jgi:hypothetical protein
MKNFRLVLALAGMLLFVCSTSFASKIRVVTNDDNCTTTSNTSSIYALDATTGALTLDKVLQTGGQGDCGGFFSNIGVTVTQNPQCLFVYDGGTNDIATWQARGGLKKVGNFTNSAVNGAFPGGSVAVSPNGKFLYATYGGSENIGAWSVGSDCSLTFINAYVAKAGADTYSALKVTPSGSALLVSAVDLGDIEMFGINASTGTLNDLGFVPVNTFSDCASAGCFPEGIDITQDNKVAIIGNASVTEPIVFTVNLASTGLSNALLWNMTNTPNIENVDIPWFSAAAYAGNGPVYLSGSGFDGGVPGVITAAFSESGPTLTLTAATQITSGGSGGIDGQVETTGNLAVVSEWFNALQTFTINSDGTLTPTSQGAVIDNNADGALSLFIFPETR